MIIGITGSIGTGKSVACEVFQSQGYEVINADHVGHELYERSSIKEKVVDTFGSEVLTDGEIDRKKLKDIVFYDSLKLKKLNSLVHPEIVKELKERIKGKDKVVVEAALLIEVEFKDCDKIILITCDKEKQTERLLSKGKYTKEEIENIISAQMPTEEKMECADIVIDNSGNKEEFEEDIKKIINMVV